MIKIDLKNFALSGNFGPVKIGMLKDEVIQLLGKPDADQDFGTGSSGLAYSWFEFFYETETGIIEAIQNDYLKANFLDESISLKNEKVELDAWFLKLNQDLTRTEVKRILNSESISFTEEKYWDHYIIKFESGVYLDFEDSFAKNGTIIINNNDLLNGIRYFPLML